MHAQQGRDNRSYTIKRRQPYPGSKGHQSLRAIVRLPKCIPHPQQMRRMIIICAQELDASTSDLGRLQWAKGHSHIRLATLSNTSCANTHDDRLVMSRPQSDRHPLAVLTADQAQRDGLITTVSRSYTPTAHGCHEVTTLPYSAGCLP